MCLVYINFLIFFLFILFFFLFYLDCNSNVHVLDVSSVVDCSHSSITSAITTKNTNTTKTTKRGHKSTKNKNKNAIGYSAAEAVQKNINTNDKPKCKKDLLGKNSEIPMKKTNLIDEQSGATSGNVWGQVVQIVHDTQNIVMMAVLLVLIYLFCYDRTVRT